MACNKKRNGWRVRLVSLPNSITRKQLAEQTNIDISKIFLSERTPIRFAWINDFDDQQGAEDFVQRNRQYQCKVYKPDDEKPGEEHPITSTVNQKSAPRNENSRTDTGTHTSNSSNRSSKNAGSTYESRPADRNRGNNFLTSRQSETRTLRPNQRFEQALEVAELNASQHDYLVSFGKEYLDIIRSEPGVDKVEIRNNKVCWIGHPSAIKNATTYLKLKLHEQQITIKTSLEKYLQLNSKGILVKKFIKKYRVGITHNLVSMGSTSLKANESTTNQNDNSKQDGEKNGKKAKNHADLDDSSDDDDEEDDDRSDDAKSDISTTSSHRINASDNGQHRARHHHRRNRIQVTLCSDSEQALSNAVQEFESYSLNNQSWILTEEEADFIQKQPSTAKPIVNRPRNNKPNLIKEQIFQIKQYLKNIIRSDTNAIVEIFVSYKRGLWRVSVRGFQIHVENAATKLKNWLNDNVQIEVQLPISRVMAIFLLTKALADLKKLERDQSVKIHIHPSPFPRQHRNDRTADNNVEKYCLKLAASKLRVHEAQKHVENFQDGLFEQEKDYPCQSWDFARIVGDIIRTRLKKLSDSDDCQAVGWLKMYTPIERRETNPKITVSMAGFSKDAVEDMHMQCEDSIEGYVIWEPTGDEFRRIFQALVVKKSPPLDEFQKQYEAEVQLDRQKTTITIPAGSKMLADDIKEALLSLGEAKKSQMNRISESIAIAQEMYRFVHQRIRRFIDEAKSQRIIVDLKQRNKLVIHGRADLVKQLKENIECTILDIKQKIIRHRLRLSLIESDFMRNNRYELSRRIEYETNTVIREIRAERDRSRLDDNDDGTSQPLITVFNDREQSISVVKGDITKVKHVDAIVNATNGALYHAGGIDKIIADAAGVTLDEQCRELIANNQGLPFSTGKAVKTTAGNLPFQSVIHAMGPQYIDGNQQERPLLFSCIMATLQLADKEKYQSIALPAISSKTYGFPLADCTNIIVRAIKQFFADYPRSSVRKVILVDMDDTACNSFAREIVADHTNNGLDNDDELVQVALAPLKAKWCWKDDHDEKIYTDDTMRLIDDAFENYLNTFQHTTLVIQPDNLQTGTITNYSIHFLPNLKEHLLKNPTALDGRLVCGYQQREGTGYQRELLRYPVTGNEQDAPIEAVPYRPKPLDLYQQQTVNMDECWQIIGLTVADIDQAEKAIRTAIHSATITETFSIHLDRDSDDHRAEILNIARQRGVELVFSDYTSGQLSIILKGFKVNVAETKSNIALYANDQLSRGVDNDDELCIPKEWGDQNEPCILVDISNNDLTFTRIENRMRETLGNVKIHRIQRVQNLRMWSHYAFRRQQLKKELHHLPQLQIEMELFHGTRSTAPSEIYNGEYGFDMTYSTSGMWGIGTYFAHNASYSCGGYAYSLPDGKRQVFLAQVLTGEVYTCPSDSSLRRPPKKNEQVSGLRYSSVSGETGGSKVYIVYENRVAYPTYLITFTI